MGRPPGTTPTASYAVRTYLESRGVLSLRHAFRAQGCGEAPHAIRYDEIAQAIAIASESGFNLRHICIVPVRMQEAWLLFNEQAIREAAGNPNGTVDLALPRLLTVEAIPDPKTVLHDLLRVASELRGRRLKKFNPGGRARQVPEHIKDFSPLWALPAFQRLEADVSHLAKAGASALVLMTQRVDWEIRPQTALAFDNGYSAIPVPSRMSEGL